ncbi:EutP/PduV family microcompartment system protein [bacterium C-53]|nr:EutP/PduV family microcompartment system protein [Lachnospiraceae bacterium]NBI03433.1 EutP/PduV family microcompartment system protein [Lachnospiraceae bacterium]RKJ09673.1 EutP/PduV family microcompartment system protein [bacterium C-53]
MKKIILMGRSEAGKTTLTQALRGETILYKKTQYINYFDVIIDTPGEYIQTAKLGRALALYSYEADVVGLLLAANEPYSLYPPNITCMVNRDVIGIVTKIDRKDACREQAERWLRLTGCKNIFFVNSKSGEGVADILEYLREPGDELPWQTQEEDQKTESEMKSGGKGSFESR